MSERANWNRVRGGDLPTSAAGTEWAIGLLIIGCQLGTLVQMVPSLPQGVATSPHPRGYLALWLLAAAAACIVSAVVWHQRRPLGTLGFGLDVVVTVVVLLAGIVVVREDLRMGTWMGYQNGYALAVVCTGAGVRSQRAWFVGLTVVTAAMGVYLFDAADVENRTTVVGNLLTLVVISSVGRWVANYIRRVAADGDSARAQALELGRREEERRAQLAIHNGATVIRMLSDPDLDAQARELLQVEAQREAARMRTYLRGDGVPLDSVPISRTDTESLAQVIGRVCQRFADLPLTTTTDLVGDVRVPEAGAAALDHALASILLNVRDHAGATSVVIHADAEDPPTSTGADGIPRGEGSGHAGVVTAAWTITVHDDGVGFDPAIAPLGVGLREVVIGQLAPHGVQVDVASSPGHGTRITLAAAS